MNKYIASSTDAQKHPAEIDTSSLPAIFPGYACVFKTELLSILSFKFCGYFFQIFAGCNVL